MLRCFFVNMVTKFIFIVLFIQNIVHPTRGQVKEKFFRQDYNYIDDKHSFYKVHTLHKTWQDAKTMCELEGAALFYPEDDDEALSVIAYWNEKQPLFEVIHVGIAAWNVREVFETIDGRPVSAVYNNWAVGEPNNVDGNEGCVILRRDGTLNDEDCNKRFPFICKKTLATLQWNNECNIPDTHYVYSEKLCRCYKFHLTPRNWTDAYAACNAEESYLAVINSEEERAHLVNITALAPKESIVGDYLYGGVHLGFKNNNGWVTVKDVRLHESGYNRWANLQPDGRGTENCGSMFFSGELNDIGCFQRMFFICEHEVQFRTEDLMYKFGSESTTKAPYKFEKIFGNPPPKT